MTRLSPSPRPETIRRLFRTARRRKPILEGLEARELLAATVAEIPLRQIGGGTTGIVAGVNGDPNLYFGSGDSIGVYNPKTQGPVLQYPIPTLGSGPGDMTVGLDDKIYFLETAANAIGVFDPSTTKITEYPIPSAPSVGLQSLTTDPQGNIWFTEANLNKVSEFNVTTHVFTEFNVPTALAVPLGITTDNANGQLYFTEEGQNKFGTINPLTHAISDEAIPASNNLGPAAITYNGVDKKIYFFNSQQSSIGSYDPGTNKFGAAITGVSVHDTNDHLVADPNGNVWITEYGYGSVDVLTVGSGTITQKVGPPYGTYAPIDGIALGSDGNLWFAWPKASRIAPLTTAGVQGSNVVVPTSVNDSGSAAVVDKNGNVWFIQQGSEQISEYNVTTHTQTQCAVYDQGSWTPQQLALDPQNGLIYYTERLNHYGQAPGPQSQLAKLDPATGISTSVNSISNQSASASSIVYDAASGGNFFFAEQGSGIIGVYNPSTASISDLKNLVPSGDSQPFGIASDSSGNLWVTMVGTNTVDRLTPTGSGVWLPAPIALAGKPAGILLGPDGNLWVAENNYHVAVISPTTDALLTELTIPNSTGDLAGAITIGPDKNIWVSTAKGVVEITPGSYATTVYTAASNQVPSGLAAGGDGNLYFTAGGSPASLGVLPLTATSQPNHLVIVSQPTSVTALTVQQVNKSGGGFGLVVAVDTSNNKVDDFLNIAGATQAGGTVTLSITPGTNPNGDTLGGTLTVPVNNGLAFFSGLSLDKVESGLTLTATYSGLSGTVVTSPINVAQPASQIAIKTQPPALVYAGTSFSFSVSTLDPNGNIDPTYNGALSLQVQSTSGGKLAGSTTVGASSGVATFSGLSISLPGTYSIVISDPTGALTATTTASITVLPGAATSLVVTPTFSSGNAAVAGQAFGLIVTAYDSLGNISTNFSGTLTVTDANGTLGGTTTATVSNGQATFLNLVLTSAGSHKLTVSGGTPPISQSVNVTVNPAATSQLIFAGGGPGTAIAGIGFNLTLVAKDQYNNITPAYVNTVELGSSDPNAIVNAAYTFTTADAGQLAIPVTLRTVGTQTITVVDPSNTTLTAQVSVVVVPGAVAQFLVSAPPSSAAGAPFSATVTAEDAFGNTETNYIGRVHFSTTDAAIQVSLPADYTFTAADQGVHTFSGVTLVTAGTQTLSVKDTVYKSATGTANVTVNPAAATMIVATPTSATLTAGSTVSVTVTAKDPFGNIAIGYAGTVQLTSTDPKAVIIPSSYTFTTGDQGTHTFAAELETTGSWTVTASDVANAGNPAFTPVVNVQVNPGPVVILLESAPVSTTAGTPFSMQVKAEDEFGNVATNFTGVIHFSSNDPTATLGLPGGNYTFSLNDRGIHTFSSVTLDTAGTWYLLVNGMGNPAAQGSTSITVNPASAYKLISTPSTSTPTAGIPFTVTVTAYDRYSNIATSFSDTVNLTSTDVHAGLVPSSSYTYSRADSGRHTFSVLLKSTGYQRVNIADASSVGVSLTWNAYTVLAPIAQQLQVSAPTTTTAGASFQITITAADLLGNTATGYNGTIQFSSSDSLASLPGNTTFTASNDGVLTFNATLRTAGIQTLNYVDTQNGALSGTLLISVGTAGASQFVVSAPATALSGLPFNATVKVEDAFGNLVSNYAGTVHESSDDTYATSLPNYSFGAIDQGVQIFPVILDSAGLHAVNFTDVALPYLRGSAPISVARNLASAAMTSSIVNPVYGDPLTFTVSVPSVQSAPAPTGTVLFSVNGTNPWLPVPLVNGSATSPSLAAYSAGNYTITASYSGDISYSQSFATPVPLTIAKAPLTVTADNKTAILNATLPALTDTITGFVNGDQPSVVSGAPVLTTANPTSAGAYPINVAVGTLSASNYVFTNLVSGTLNVTGESPSDFLGLGHAEPAVYQPSTAQWSVLGPNNVAKPLTTFGWANLNDIPVPGDYDGVGHSEEAVYRPSTGQWFVLQPNGSTKLLATFGWVGHDIPVPGDYVGLGHTEPAVYRPSTGQWFVLEPNGTTKTLATFGWTNLHDIPVPGDYDGVGHTEVAVFRPSTGQWFVHEPNGTTETLATFGGTGYVNVPVETSIGSLIDLGVIGGGVSMSRFTETDPAQPAPLAAVKAMSVATTPALTVPVAPKATATLARRENLCRPVPLGPLASASRPLRKPPLHGAKSVGCSSSVVSYDH